MRKKRGVLALAGCLAVIVSVCLGVAYDFLQGPLCWSCWSSKNVFEGGCQQPVAFVHFWVCQKCNAGWSPGEPWAASHLIRCGGEKAERSDATRQAAQPAFVSVDFAKRPSKVRDDYFKQFPFCFDEQ